MTHEITLDLDPSLSPLPLDRKLAAIPARLLNPIRQENEGPQRLVHAPAGSGNWHTGYLSYLEACWASHRSPILTPDVLWHACLCELASLIRDNAEACRSDFTESTAAIEISVPTGDPVVLPVDTVVAALESKVPGGASHFLPTFTTTTPDSRRAMASAFCDAVSPYYTYSMYLCGFPKIIVRGSAEDYRVVAAAWRSVPDSVKACDRPFFGRVAHIVSDITQAIADPGNQKWLPFWKKMFTSSQCGSGHQMEVDGWMTALRRKQPGGLRYACNYDPHIACVRYTELTSKRKFAALSGVIGSRELSDSSLEPVFGELVLEVLPLSKSA